MTDKNGSAILDKSEFFEISAKTDYVDLPNGKRMKIRELTSDERVEFAKDNADKSGRMVISDRSKDSIAKVVMWGAITEVGDPIFTDEDRTVLRSGSGSLVDLVATAVLNLSGMGAGAVEAKVKN